MPRSTAAPLLQAQPHDPAGKRYRYLVLFMLMLVYCTNYMDRQVISILAVPIKTELKLSDTQLGLMGGFAFAIFYSLLGIPIARLADRRSRVKIISAALAMWSACTALCGIASSFPQLLAARLAVGVGEAGGVAPTYSLLSDYFPPRQRSRAMAFVTIGLPIGSGLGLLLGGYFAQSYGWRAAFFLLGVIGLLLCPFVLFIIREPVRGGLDATPPRDADIPQASLVDVLRVLSKRPSFWFLSFGAAAAAMLSYGLGFWLPAYIYRSQGLTLVTTSYALSGITAGGGIAGIAIGGIIGDRLGANNKSWHGYIPSIAFAIGMPFLLLAMMATTLTSMLALLFVPLAMGVVWTGPAISAVQHLAPPHMRATVSAIFLFILNLTGLGVGTLAFGYISDVYTARFGDDALRYSIMTVAVVLYPSAVILFALGARRLEADWEV